MKVCHITTLPMESMGSITRNIYNLCIGDHVWCYLWDKHIEADIYILHCFKKHFKKFIKWKAPNKGKIISLLHSSEPCAPNKKSDLIVTISKTQQAQIYEDSKMIYPGIERFNPPSKYNYTDICKIARPEPGKFANGEAKVIDSIVNKYGNVYSLMCSNPQKVKYKIPKRAALITNISIAQNQEKALFFEDKGIYADAHGDFEDTFCIALLEAMANGLACVVMRKGNNYVLDEVLGNAGIIVDSIGKFEFAIEALIKNNYMRDLYSNLARIRARNIFPIERMIVEWNQVLVS